MLRQLSGRVSDLTDFLIGAVAGSEPYQLPKRQGKTADGWYWKGLTHADRCRQRAELLSTTAADLAAFAAPLERMTEQASICVVGSRRQIEDCGGELDDVIVL